MPHVEPEGVTRDTIAAVATPPGRGGIGILRISGPSSLACVSPLLGSAALPPHRPTLRTLRDPETRTPLDEALVTLFPAPGSYTGEDVIEISAHGSPVLLDRLLRLLLASRARLARPGEFTERAFLNGRLDLSQAEAVRDLIDAQTVIGAQVAAQQLGGSLSRAVAGPKEALVTLIALLEAGIDFAEDDTPVVSDAELLARIDGAADALRVLERTFAQGRLLHEGAILAIVGRPNAGKSSLFNRLLARERAIVTAEPGTTRDTVQERFSVDGIPIELIDTAGLREAANEAERIGIERSRAAFADASIVLLVLDATQELNAEETALLQAAQDRPLLIACNKCDLAALSPAALAGLQALAPDARVTDTSAATGAGIETLRAAIVQRLTGKSRVAPESAMLTNLRQHSAIAEALAALSSATQSAAAHIPHEMMLLDLYTALAALDSLTGATTADDILNRIFSTFCIGK